MNYIYFFLVLHDKHDVYYIYNSIIIILIIYFNILIAFICINTETSLQFGKNAIKVRVQLE